MMESIKVWEICKFWILQTVAWVDTFSISFERYVNFEFYKTNRIHLTPEYVFERYVNFEFYKTLACSSLLNSCLRDM